MSKLSRYIPYGRQSIDKEDIDAVVSVLKGDFITQGPIIEEFERAIASYCGARYAVAVSSGTAALHIACLAAGLGKGDTLWTSPNSFAASANCALYCGARPDFVDIDLSTYNVSADILEKRLIESNKNGHLPKIVIPVHFAGQPCDMEEIKRLSDKYGFKIIEDACHATGAQWRDPAGTWHKVGSSSHSDMTVMSFHPVKHITTGEGGLILTNDRDYFEKLKMLRNHGFTKRPEKILNKDMGFCSDQSDPNPWYYEMQHLGYNFRITDIQCALGLSQLKKVDGFVARRIEIAARYREALNNVAGLKLPCENDNVKPSWHIYPVLLDFETLNITRAEFMNSLKIKGVGSQVHYIPIYRHPLYRELGYKEGYCPNAEEYYSQELSIPMFPGMKNKDADFVCSSLMEVCGER